MWWVGGCIRPNTATSCCFCLLSLATTLSIIIIKIFLAFFRLSSHISFDKYLLVFQVQQNCTVAPKIEMAAWRGLRTWFWGTWWLSWKNSESLSWKIHLTCQRVRYQTASIQSPCPSKSLQILIWARLVWSSHPQARIWVWPAGLSPDESPADLRKV